MKKKKKTVKKEKKEKDFHVRVTSIEKFIAGRKLEDAIYDLGTRHIDFQDACSMLGMSVRTAQGRKLQKYWYAGSKNADGLLKLQARGMAGKSPAIMKLLLEAYCGIKEGLGKIVDDETTPPKIVAYGAMTENEEK